MDLFGAAGSIVGQLATAVLSSPIKDFNSMMGMINAAIEDPVAGGVNAVSSAISSANPYAGQNVLKAVESRGEPAMAFDWIAVIVDSNPATSLPWYFIDTISTPGLTLAQHDKYFNGLTKKYASALTVDSLSLGLFTDSNGTAFNYAVNWFQSTYREDGFFSLPSQYKRDVLLYVLDSKRKTIIDIRFVGCMITSYPAYTFGASNDPLTTELTLSCDQVIFNTEASLSKAAARFKNQWPGIAKGAVSSLLDLAK